MAHEKKKIILGITGATGVVYGIRTLEILHKKGQEVHLIITDAGIKNIEIETPFKLEDVKAMAQRVYDIDDLTAPIASGSCIMDGMIVIPCTIKTLSAIANSFNHNLLVRAADVTLKERRRLVLVVRETPLHEGHLRLMLRVTRMGGIIMPPVPSFYHKPKSIEDIIDQTVGKVLDMFGIDARLFERWGNHKR
ncbi:MAG: UbiX family flavin prenyltransferase [Desulfobacterota bacterium]|nr:UbiX family flavin prenyltransferase [Thermodesulfobacteriota bacterium]MDW8001868.1 UbiX family flavin prenyltransferase [Deltaproteobacteria bacterium]